MSERKLLDGGCLPDAASPEIDGIADQISRWAHSLAAINNYMQSLSIYVENGNMAVPN